MLPITAWCPGFFMVRLLKINGKRIAQYGQKIKQRLDPTLGSQFMTRIVMACDNPNKRIQSMQNNVSKEDWVDMFRDIGLTQDQMGQWHRLFETRHPEGHGSFLAWLGLPSGDIAEIRERYQ